MGWFDTIKYSTKEHYLAKEEIKHIVTMEHVHSLTSIEAEMVRCLIEERRHGDGMISLQQIYEVLTRLKNERKISTDDREGLMRELQKHFEHKFG